MILEQPGAQTGCRKGIKQRCSETMGGIKWLLQVWAGWALASLHFLRWAVADPQRA